MYCVWFYFDATLKKIKNEKFFMYEINVQKNRGKNVQRLFRTTCARKFYTEIIELWFLKCTAITGFSKKNVGKKENNLMCCRSYHKFTLQTITYERFIHTLQTHVKTFQRCQNWALKQFEAAHHTSEETRVLRILGFFMLKICCIKHILSVNVFFCTQKARGPSKWQHLS